MDRRRAGEAGSRPQRADRRAADERGAVLVEAGFILPVVLLIVFGIIEFGLMFASASTTTSSTRSGARLAAATYAPSASPHEDAADDIRDAVEQDLTSLTAQGTPMDLWIYRADPTSPDGAPVGSADFSTCATDCHRYTWNGAAFDNRVGSWMTPDACGDDVDSVAVLVRVKHDFVSGFILPNRTLTEHTTMRLEPLPQNQCP